MQSRIRRGIAGSLFAALAVACDSTEPHRLRVESVELPTPTGLAQPMRIALSQVAPLEVVYGVPDQPPLRIAAPPAQLHDLILTRLPADADIHWLINGTDQAGIFHTPPLPDDLAAIEFQATGQPTVPLALVHLFHPAGFQGYAIVDGDGEVVWWWRTAGFPYGAARRENGNWVFLDGVRGLIEVTPAGEVLHELAHDPQQRQAHHDAIVTPANTVLFIAFDEQIHAGAPLLGEAIWEWTPESGAATKRWSAWDHLSPDIDRGPRFGEEWLHANALSIGPRGNILVSFHFINQIVSITPDWAALEWRLGGVNATIPLDAEEQFTGQHAAREVMSGRVVLFDNAIERRGPSRAIELEFDGQVATRRWEWMSENRNFASAVSSARRLENGNTLVAFGMSAGQMGATGPTEFYEVSEAGEVVWHVVVKGTSVMFRAEPVESVGGERRTGEG